MFSLALLTSLCLGIGGGLLANAAAQTTDGQSNKKAPAGPLRVACVGDSITQGVHVRGEDNYPTVLGNLLGERYQVRNFGFLGGTVMNVNDRPFSACAEFKAATAFNPDVVIFMLGTNDSKPDEWKHKERFKQDLISLLAHFADLPAKPKIWVCTPAWVAKHYPGGHDEEVLGKEILPIIRAVAAEKKLPLIDIHAALDGKPEMYVDGVHPNAAGCAIMAQAVFKALAPPKAEPPKAEPASLRVDRMFSDHMVLQRDLPAPVWGTAVPGDTVTVSFRDQQQQAQADHDGKWQAKLDPLKAGEAGALTICDTKDNATVTFTDVLVGEVWIGSGQSNMEGATRGYRKDDDLLGFELAGEDGKWNWAEAMIDGDTVVVRNAAVPKPIHVRYAYSPQPGYANLFNKDGLPALTFTTEPLGQGTMPSQGRWQ